MTERLDEGGLGALDPQLAKLVEDTRVADASSPTFGTEASTRVLERVRAAIEPPAPAPAASKLTLLSSIALLASLAAIAALVGTEIVSSRARALPDAPAPSAIAPAASPAAQSAEGPAPGPANIPQMRIDDLPSSAAPPSRPPLHPTPGAKSSASASDLAEEYRLIESARAGLASKQPATALRAVHDYEARFPNGQLAQECESLHIQALVLAGRIDEARERGASFRRRFPGGLLLPSVVRAIASSPSTPEPL